GHEPDLQRPLLGRLLDAREERHRRAEQTLHVPAQLRRAIDQRRQPRPRNAADHGRVHDADLAETDDREVHVVSTRASVLPTGLPLSGTNVRSIPSAKLSGAKPKSRSASVISGAFICLMPTRLSTVTGGFFSIQPRTLAMGQQAHSGTCSRSLRRPRPRRMPRMKSLKV